MYRKNQKRARLTPRGQCVSSSVSAVANACSDARSGMNSSVQFRFSSCRLDANAGVDQQHLVELECLFHEGELEQAAGEFVKERGRRGNQLLAGRPAAGHLAGKVRGQGIEIGAAHDVGGLLGGRLLELAPARRRADGLMQEQVHQRQARAILEDQEDLTTQAARSGPSRSAATRVSGGPRTSAASVSSTSSTSLIVSRTSSPEPLRERLRGALGPALEDHPEQPALRLTQNRFHQGRPPRKTEGPRKQG